MEAKIDNVKFVTKWLQSKVRQAKELVEREIEKIPEQAKRNYNRFVPEVPADDPYVDVSSSLSKDADNTKLEITCGGRNVLFIEFGAGVHCYTETELRLYKPYMAGINPRPSTISNIGEYGIRGKDDYWFYRSETGRGSTNSEQIRYSQRTNAYTMITIGNRPSRSLYRAVGMAKKRIFSKYARKPRRIGG